MALPTLAPACGSMMTHSMSPTFNSSSPWPSGSKTSVALRLTPSRDHSTDRLAAPRIKTCRIEPLFLWVLLWVLLWILLWIGFSSLHPPNGPMATLYKCLQNSFILYNLKPCAEHDYNLEYGDVEQARAKQPHSCIRWLSGCKGFAGLHLHVAACHATSVVSPSFCSWWTLPA